MSSVSPPPAEPTPQRYPRLPLRYFGATRPAFLSVTLAGCLIGLAAAYADGIEIDAATAAVTVLFALLAHAGANVINDYHDALSGTDATNTRRIFPFTGGSRFIQNGVLTARETAILGYTLLGLVVPPGLWLAARSGSGLLGVGLVGIGLAWAYSSPPLKLVSRGLGEFAVAACWLLVVVGADYVQRGLFAWTPFAAGLSFALLVANLLYLNQFPDRAADAAAGKRTLVVRLGAETAKSDYFAIALVAYGWLVLQIGRNNLPQACGAAALTLVLSFHAARMLREHADQPQLLAPAIRLTIAAANVHGFVLAATLAFGTRP